MIHHGGPRVRVGGERADRSRLRRPALPRPRSRAENLAPAGGIGGGAARRHRGGMDALASQDQGGPRADAAPKVQGRAGVRGHQASDGIQTVPTPRTQEGPR